MLFLQKLAYTVDVHSGQIPLKTYTYPVTLYSSRLPNIIDKDRPARDTLQINHCVKACLDTS